VQNIFFFEALRRPLPMCGWSFQTRLRSLLDVSFISTRFNEIQGSNKNNDENQALNLTTETGK